MEILCLFLDLAGMGKEGGGVELGAGPGLNVFAHSLPYRIESLSAQ